MGDEVSGPAHESNSSRVDALADAKSRQIGGPAQHRPAQGPRGSPAAAQAPGDGACTRSSTSSGHQRLRPLFLFHLVSETRRPIFACNVPELRANLL
jgi:hypothetical protein